MPAKELSEALALADRVGGRGPAETVAARMIAMPEVSVWVDRYPRPAARDMNCEPRNFLRPCLLLLLAEQADHGYGLVERLKPLGVADGNPGAVYRTLRDLEKAGLLQSGWKASPAGPARRVYRLTDSGHASLEAWGMALRLTHRAVGEYLDRHAVATGCTATPAAVSSAR